MPQASRRTVILLARHALAKLGARSHRGSHTGPQTDAHVDTSVLQPHSLRLGLRVLVRLPVDTRFLLLKLLLLGWSPTTFLYVTEKANSPPYPVARYSVRVRVLRYE